MGGVLEQLIQQIQSRLDAGDEPDQAEETVRGNLERLGVPEDTLARVSEARHWLQESVAHIDYLQPPILTGRRAQPNWYAGPQAGDVFWPALKRSFGDQMGLSDEAVDTIDNESTQVVKLLDHPGAESFATRGLVVGRVQSGKTANLTSVMAKAADRGFRFFIVLAGMTNALRNQTEERLERDLVQIDRARWMRWTDVNQDFFLPVNRAFQYTRGYQIAVVKKNKTVLEHLVAALANTHDSLLRELPFMVIDDECDQASVNAADSQYDMSAINGLIRQILTRLPRVAYIGYTATPFANVLIDPAIDVNPDHPDDLYPKDFIFALHQPPGYFGPETLFGRDLVEGDDVPPADQGLDLIHIVHAEEPQFLRPPRAEKDEFTPQVTPSLEEAVRYYLLATAARCSRGQGDKHSSMLVHTTIYTTPHFRLQEVLEEYRASLEQAVTAQEPTVLRELRDLWEREAARVDSEHFELEPVSFDALQPHLADVVRTVEVAVENNESDTRLEFGETTRRYIVVGGSVLSRGLTIEGLVVTFFLRTSSQYDSLMQMGRWFGYRPGYEDLPRVWMTADLSRAFRDMATVEAEIRYDIEEYARRQVTPLEFAVRIRQIPGMAITARNKMLAAKQCDLSFSGEHVQTRRFLHRDAGWLEQNWLAGEALINRSFDEGARHEHGRGGMVFRGVGAGAVQEFLREYRIHETHRDMAKEHLLDYIERQNRSGDTPLSNWNVAVVQPGRGQGGPSARPLGRLGAVRTLERAKISPEEDESADIKALMSRQDILVDVRGEAGPDGGSWQRLKEFRADMFGSPVPPLLLLYPIYRDSQPRPHGNRRPLEAVEDILGVGIVFPDAGQSEPGGYVRVNLPEYDYGEGEELEEAP